MAPVKAVAQRWIFQIKHKTNVALGEGCYWYEKENRAASPSNSSSFLQEELAWDQTEVVYDTPRRSLKRVRLIISASCRGEGRWSDPDFVRIMPGRFKAGMNRDL